MRLDPATLTRSFEVARAGKESRHAVTDRLSPSIFQYDFLALRSLSDDIEALISVLPAATPGAVALDLGADRCPYRRRLEARGFVVETLDLAPESGADHTGRAEETGLPDAAFELVLCTQVLEHTHDPLRVMLEIRRLLRPGGWMIASAPHVWFYHPHPSDCWRFTQEGVVRLCEQTQLDLLELRAQGGSVLTLFQICNFLLYGALGRIGAPVFAGMNVIGRGLDRLIRNDLFCHNFAWLARRPL